MMYSGDELKDIPNKQYMTIETAHAAEIVKGLDLSGVPYFAKHDENVMYLTFSAENRSAVDEIIRKAESGDYEEMMLQLSENKSDGYAPLIPEIAEILHCAVGSVTARPPELVETLAKTYINYWHSDRQTIQEALERIIDLNTETENEVMKHSITVNQQNNTPEKRVQSDMDDIRHTQAVALGAEERRRIEDGIIIEQNRSVYLSREAHKRLAEEKRRKSSAKAHSEKEKEIERERKKF